jgi:hypothetical protein
MLSRYFRLPSKFAVNAAITIESEDGRHLNKMPPNPFTGRLYRQRLDRGFRPA